MTQVYVHGNVRIVHFKDEQDAQCELCGNEDEVRPYGPNGEMICFGCGMKDEATTMKRMFKHLYDIELTDEEINRMQQTPKSVGTTPRGDQAAP